VRCPALPIVQYGEYNNVRCADPNNPGKYEDVCKVMCNQGYAISEEDVEWKCLLSKTWTNKEKKVTCGCGYLVDVASVFKFCVL